MIRKIKFSNFYSFKDEQVLDFTAQKKTSYSYYNSKFNDQVSKITGFIGPNASGKTNVMRILSFFGHFIATSTKDDSNPDLNIAFRTFFNNKNQSSFYIEFELDHKIFYYEFAIKDDRILKESLSYVEAKKYARLVKVFERDGAKISYLNELVFDGSSQRLPKIRQDVSLIAFLKSIYDIELINLVYGYFVNLKTNINERGQINNANHQVASLRLYLSDPEISQEMNRFIRNFDVGLQEFDVTEKIDQDRTIITASGVHLVDNVKINLGFEYESRGTQQLFFTLAKIIYAIRHNVCVVLDELEFGLHPEALNKLISYFIDESADKTAQLFFSSHDLGFVNFLDTHQIYLVAKNEDGQSFSDRLSKVDGIRSDANHLAKYMSGAYGAFPKIRV